MKNQEKISMSSLNSYTWIFHVFSIELRRIMASRFDFWLKFFILAGIQLITMFYLWKNAFAQQELAINGFTFAEMMWYYIFVIFLARINIDNDYGFLSQDVYFGVLNIYLTYPISYHLYKYVTCFAKSCIYILQLSIVFGIYIIFFAENIHPIFFLGVLLFILISNYLAFCIDSIIELTAFWAENVWNLRALMQLITYLLGGYLIPLTFFPKTALYWIYWTPFPYLISIPVQMLLDPMDFKSYLQNLFYLICLCGMMTLVIKKMWKVGLKRYAGVGI